MPDAVWVATACLHRERGMHRTFSETDISIQVVDLKISSTDYHYIASNIYSYCVANHHVVSSHRHRKLYRTGVKGQRRYRLYRPDYDDCDPGRKNGDVEPDPAILPAKYQDCIDWYRNKYCKDAHAELEPPGVVDVANMKGDPPPTTTEAVTRFARDATGARRLKDMYKD